MSVVSILKFEVAALRSLRVRMQRLVDAYEPASSLALPVRTKRIGLSIQNCPQADPPSPPAGNPGRGAHAIPPGSPPRSSPTFFSEMPSPGRSVAHTEGDKSLGDRTTEDTALVTAGETAPFPTFLFSERQS